MVAILPRVDLLVARPLTMSVMGLSEVTSLGCAGVLNCLNLCFNVMVTQYGGRWLFYLSEPLSVAAGPDFQQLKRKLFCEQGVFLCPLAIAC